MSSPQEFYLAEKEKRKTEYQSLTRRVRSLGLVRLLVFAGTATGIYLLWGRLSLVIPVAVVGFGLFLYLVSKHAAVKRKRTYTKKLITINETELKVLNREFAHLPDGKEYQSPDHAYSYDLDLFGHKSVFQFLNRTVTKSGKDCLSRKLTSNNIKHIAERQAAIRELSSKASFRQGFSAEAMVATEEKEDENTVSQQAFLAWIQNYKRFVPDYFKWLPYVFGSISLILIIAVLFIPITYWFLIGWFAIGLGVAGRYFKKTTSLANYCGEANQLLTSYATMIKAIEDEDWQSDLLVRLREKLIVDGAAASERLRQFTKDLDLLEQRNNLLIGSAANGLLLWDPWRVRPLEEWLEENQSFVGEWFSVLSEMDALNSLGNYAFNHPDFVFPEIQSGSAFSLQAKSLIHPLMEQDQAVGNDVKINSGEFFIITGANMAGKSTFLRTLGMTVVLANIGLPVPAKSIHYAPTKLLTSMRTSDSLMDDESYFFSELKRLKFIVDKLEDDSYLIILDEILKGTNSRDKAEGSKKLVSRLANENATGVIATHDLSLTSIAREYEAISNYYFDATIEQDQLSFDYKMREGVAENMNASFLLRQMGITK